MKKIRSLADRAASLFYSGERGSSPPILTARSVEQRHRLKSPQAALDEAGPIF